MDRKATVLAPLVLIDLVSDPRQAPLALGQLPDDAQLVDLLWQNSPELQQARARVAQVRADFERSVLLPNPSIDLSANTLPIGATNPGNGPETSPLANIPNYAIG